MQISSNRLLRGLLLTFVYLIGILGIAASGGGSGSGGGDDGDDGPTSISYSGNTDPAVISRSNATRLVDNVLIGQIIVGSSSGVAAKSDISIDTTAHGIGLAQFPGRLTQMLRNTMQSSPGFLSRSTTVRARTDIDDTEPCDNNGGSVHITGFIEDTGTGTLTLEYINCREGDETLDGTVTVQINAFDFGFLLPTDAIYNFAILTLTSSTINVSLSGSIHSQVSIGTETEQLTVDRLVARNNATGEMLMITNQVSVISYDNIFSPSSFSETITGRIYDSTYGYVDFTTIVAIAFSTITQEYPDGGQLLLAGSLNSGIQVTVISDTHTSLDLDLDGDTTFEIAHTVSWAEIEAETELTDTDGDGMHDSWEQANGLDPSDPSDAGMDRDLDGFINLEEYLAGTDLDDASDIPPSADLSISKSGSGVPLTSSNYSYLVNTTNLGPSTAINVQVMDTLPVGAAFAQAFGSGWNCSNSGATVLCSRDSMPPGASPILTITVTLPANPGIISNTAAISSVILDPNPVNDTATIQTDVLLSNADLSISILSNPTAVLTGNSFIYVIKVDNNGPSAATDVVLSDNLPANVTFDSAAPTQGSCSGTTTITCDFGNIDPSSFAAVNFFVTGASEGIAENTVTVTSSSLDLDLSNNSASFSTAVGTSTSVIQDAINASTNGDTITVPPGIYIGNIDFIGKEITVISEQGPLVTIIDGVQAGQAVISLVNGEGPGAVFSGFTVQNGGNGGINVSGGSPMITDNIIQNNFKPGSGVGIEVAFSSATVSGNIIRGNDRGSGSGGGGGGISVRGAASAQILDNLIVDNLWGGGIELFAAGTPLVRNNLISGNVGFGLGIVNAMEGEIVQNLIVQNIGPGIIDLRPNGTFTGNTIASNSGPGIDTFGFPAGIQFYNNIIVGAPNNPAIECSSFGFIDSNLFQFNNVYSSGASPYAGICVDQTGVNGNISVAPEFVDSTNEDYRLMPTSPVIDAGDNAAPSLPIADFLGNGRIVDGDQNGSAIADIGAYEYIP